MKQLRIFIWLKVKEIGVALLVIIGMIYIFVSILVIKESLAVGFDIAIRQWPFYVCIPGGLIGLVGLSVWVYLGITTAPKWLRSNWKKAGELAKGP